MEVVMILAALGLAAAFVVWKASSRKAGADDLSPLTCDEARAALATNRRLLQQPLSPGQRAMVEARIAQFERYIAENCGG